MNDQHLDLTPYIGTIAVVWLLLWLLPAFVAAIVAPDERRKVFFWLTFFFLGPVGVGFAALATNRPPKPLPNMATLYCIRCDARQNIDIDATSFDCWRCGQQHE